MHDRCVNCHEEKKKSSSPRCPRCTAYFRRHGEEWTGESRNQWTPEVVEAIVARREAGETLTSIADDLGAHVSTVSRAVGKHTGRKPRARVMSDDKFIRVWNQSKTALEVSKETGYSINTVRAKAYKLRRLGLNVKRIGPGGKPRRITHYGRHKPVVVIDDETVAAMFQSEDVARFRRL
jgi:hypothetical protein